MIGKTITLNPTEGGYQKPQQALVISETPTRFTVRIKGRGCTRTFLKATGQPYAKADKEFPRYVANTDSLGEQ